MVAANSRLNATAKPSVEGKAVPVVKVIVKTGARPFCSFIDIFHG